jgi:hypothetical protein
MRSHWVASSVQSSSYSVPNSWDVRMVLKLSIQERSTARSAAAISTLEIQRTRTRLVRINAMAEVRDASL